MIAHLDLDSFFVAVECARDPALYGRPVIIGGRPGGRGRVAAASRPARKRGVRIGLPLSQAGVQCPEAVFLEGSLSVYLDASRRVDAIVRRYSSLVEWISIDELFVDLTCRHPGGIPDAGAVPAVQALETIQQEVHGLGLSAACGLARSKLVSRIASRLAHPRGIVHVLGGYESRFLSPLKIELLPGVPLAVVQRLRRAGVRRLGQLARLDETQITALAGRGGLALSRLAAGIDPARVRRVPPPPSPLLDENLASPSTDHETIARAVEACAERLARDLRARRLLARAITLRLRYADGRIDSRTASLDGPSSLDTVLASVAADLLDRLPASERAVVAVGISSAGYAVPAAGDPELFPLSSAS
ncbi:MAG TPA: hypothetical protein VFX12_11985 [Vicinamibacterales bacterium]|nr:hypothetical protein [Vicinamibacterales bacterium]